MSVCAYCIPPLRPSTSHHVSKYLCNSYRFILLPFESANENNLFVPFDFERAYRLSLILCRRRRQRPNRPGERHWQMGQTLSPGLQHFFFVTNSIVTRLAGSIRGRRAERLSACRENSSRPLMTTKVVLRSGTWR